MLSRKKSMLILAVVLAAGIVAAAAIAALRTATPSQRDIAATRTYLLARSRLEQALAANLPDSRGALNAFVANISDMCPKALRGAPLNGRRSAPGNGSVGPAARDLLVAEVEKGLEITLLRSQAAARREFVRTVAHLGWGDRRVTNIIRAVVNTEAAWLMNNVPSACHDIKAWVASGYRRLPINTERVLFGLQPVPEKVSKELVALGYGRRFPERDILQLLKRYQHSNEGLERDRVEQFEIRMSAEGIKLLREAMARIEKALGLPYYATR